MGVSRDFPIFWVPPYNLRNGKNHEIQIWPVHLQGPPEQKPVKIVEKKERGCNPGTAQFFGGTPYWVV